VATYANQSVDLGAVLDAVALLCRKALGWHADRVVEHHAEHRNNLDEGRSVVWYQLVGRKPDTESGAGRHGTKVPVVVAVRLVTRMFLDRADKDKLLGRAHWARQFLLENAFYGRFLHDAYDDRVPDDPPMPTQEAGIISAGGTMVMADIPAWNKPRPEQGYLETQLLVEIPCVLRLTLDDVPASDE
jgi:hypothetical protein